MSRSYTVLVDRREKKPLPFPAHLVVAAAGQNPSARRTETVRLRTERKTMETADYRLADHPTNCYALEAEGSRYVAIETKRSWREIASQTLTDKRRATLARCLDRLADMPGVPLVVFEEPTSHPRIPDNDRVVAQDTFIRMLLERGLPWISLRSNSLPQRRATAEFVARFLIQGARINGSR